MFLCLKKKWPLLVFQFLELTLDAKRTWIEMVPMTLMNPNFVSIFNPEYTPSGPTFFGSTNRNCVNINSNRINEANPHNMLSWSEIACDYYTLFRMPNPLDLRYSNCRTWYIIIEILTTWMCLSIRDISTYPLITYLATSYNFFFI